MAGTDLYKLALSIATIQIITLQSVMSLTPTVFPAVIFDPEADATRLMNSMKGFGTDEDTIIDILAHRNNMQRLRIAQKFATMYGKNLVQELKSELSGDFEDAIVALMTPMPEFYAREIFDAITNLGTNEAALIEILATLSYNGIKTIAETYKKRYGIELVEHVKGHTSGSFGELLVFLCYGLRGKDQSGYFANADAQKLFETVQLHRGIDTFFGIPEYVLLEPVENLLANMLIFRSNSQLRSIFKVYDRISGISIEDVILQYVPNDLVDSLLALVTLVRNPAIYFAEQLYKAMDGLGTDEKTLIRIIVARSEVDLGDIKTEYARKYGNSLAADIEEDCSGDLKTLLITLLG